MPHVKSRRDMYAEATRAAVLEQAATLFAERGYTATSLADVAVAAQVTRGAVYHHFDGKRALFQAVLEELELAAIERIAASAADVDDPWQAALTALDTFLDECCDPTYGRVVWQEGPAALGWTQWRECEEKYAFGLVEQLVRSLREANYLPPRDLPTMTWLCFHMLGGAGLRLAETPPERKREVRDECAALLRAMFGGLRAGVTPRAGG
ncbi:TetR/AcrR family transcriptional regulator [Haloechinothrix sp. LS1_15]|uniref:TetR/AcrR family transcriptional regulator n=1 Tax=Haloechinothrix sp. LS1_15 TaxID=2652248 RepID=UPI0029441191|nr:TetR/AcrR family transcriptional regulator [Haloechinothrix sp. LS1_15]MDV6011717.1 TetR/AcrR family transcriptional regulator [Haloechinothrix sp. LS1_15]